MTPAIWLTHTRADIYPEPFAFKPERFLEDGPDTYSWIPFGGSVRRCIGATFAEFEMRVVLREVLTRCELHKASPLPETTGRRNITLSPKDGNAGRRHRPPTRPRAGRCLTTRFEAFRLHYSSMEALLERGTDVENWNDERLDELSRRMDAGFEKVATKVELTAVKDEMNLRLAKSISASTRSTRTSARSMTVLVESKGSWTGSTTARLHARRDVSCRLGAIGQPVGRQALRLTLSRRTWRGSADAPSPTWRSCRSRRSPRRRRGPGPAPRWCR